VLQGIIGIAILLIIGLFISGTFPAAGLLLPMGYGQGPGQAYNWGHTYEVLWGFEHGTSFGLTIAATGFISASVGGIFYLERLKRKGLVKTAFEDEMLVSLKVDMKQDLTEISRYIYGDVKKIREAGTNSIDGTLKFLQKLPRFVNGIFVGLMRMLIYFDLYPSQFQKGDTNYSSVLISNLGSIKCDAPYHHLNNFGTNSVVICIGQIHKQEVITETGDKQIRDVVNFGITIDERIADGFYFAKSIRLLQFILSNPNLLERPIGEKIEYED
jgi:hypothetical protein